jgi:prefoldin subunit 5
MAHINQKDYIVIFLINKMENERLIINKLDILKAEVDSLKEHIMDVTLTAEDLQSIKEAEEDLRKGRTKRL